MLKRNIPINNGFFNVKSLCGEIFRSCLQETTYNNILSTNDVLTYNGKSYVIGVGEPNLEMDKTKNDFNKILILDMLCRFMSNEKKASFKVVLSMPINIYFEQNEEDIKKYLIDTHKVKFNGDDKEIIIEDIRVLPETAITYANLEIDEELEDKTFFIFDIGGYATNICRIKGGEFNKGDYITEQYGMYHIDYEISQMLNQKLFKHDFNCTYEDICVFRKHGLFFDEDIDYMDVYKRDIELIEHNIIKYLLNKCKTKKWNLKGNPVIITGGGGMTLYKTITESFLPKAILSDDPVFDNVKALDRFGEDAFE